MFGIRSIAWLIALCIAANSAAVQAEAYPTRPVRFVVGFTPGGGGDINARLLASKLSELLGQQVIVDNRPGAGTNIANELVAKAAPDGYTLLVASPAVAINAALYKNLPYDTLRDFAAISIFSESPNVLVVNSSSPAKSMLPAVHSDRHRSGTGCSPRRIRARPTALPGRSSRQRERAPRRP